ncbi:hypothetical protein ACE6H2_009896 [Prunus campanulata]
MIAHDERLRAPSEILNSMKTIKLQSWEEKFKNYVDSLRECEFKWLSDSQFKKAYGTLMYWMSPTVISSVIFLGCILVKSAPLNASTIFTVLAALRSIGDPVRLIPEALSVMIQVKVSFDRLNVFLLDDELKDNEVRQLSSQNSDEILRIERGIFSWYPESAVPTLRDVNLEVQREQKVVVCGPVGTGKSSLLCAILGEMPKISGTDCVMAALAKKIVILVTHQVEFISEVDKILVMEGGKVTQSGSYESLLTVGTAFEQLVNAHKDAVTTLGPSNYQSQGESEKGDMVLRKEPHGAYLTVNNSEGDISVKGIAGVQLTEEEEKEIGDVGWKPFWDYIFVSRGTLLLWLGIIAESFFSSLQAAATYWLALGIQIPKLTSGVLIGVYAAISALSAVFVYLRSFFAAHMGLKASRAFYSGFTDAIFKAPMLFFDSTPVGRILIRDYYLASARELIRIKAPVMNYASETSLGVVTIRAFKMADRFFHNYLELVDTDARLFFHSNATVEWLILRTETLQNLTLFTAAFFIVLLPKGYVAPELVGLSLSYALSLTATQIFATQWYCSISNYIISVERIKQFMQIVPEPPAIVEDKRPASSWPPKGRIELYSLAALEKCQLKATVSKLPSLLDSSGKLVEYEEPSKLLDTNSYFSKLVAEYWSSCKRN